MHFVDPFIYSITRLYQFLIVQDAVWIEKFWQKLRWPHYCVLNLSLKTDKNYGSVFSSFKRKIIMTTIYINSLSKIISILEHNSLIVSLVNWIQTIKG